MSLFKPVNEQMLRTIRNEETGEVDIPSGKYLVIDPNSLTDDVGATLLRLDEAIVGEIEYPLDFCPSDKTACPNGTGYYSQLMRPDGTGPVLVYHTSCFRPTKAWWNSTFRALVNVKEGFKLPWS